MEFKLSDYIKSKYLNESLQSDTLQNILHDKSGLFNCVKSYYLTNSTFLKAHNIYKDINNIIDKILWNMYNNGHMRYPFNLYLAYDIDKCKSYYYKCEGYQAVVTSDDDFLMLYYHYKQLYDYYMDLVPKLFDKPDPRILTLIGETGTGKTSNLNLYNITDDQFRTYTLEDIKNNKETYKEAYQLVSTHIAIFKTFDNNICAVTKKNNIILSLYDKTLVELKSHISKDMLQNCEQKLNINVKGKSIEIPVLKLTDDCGTAYIENNLMYDDIKINEPIGAFYHKSSTIQKKYGWGNNPKDEIIIYVPFDSYNDGTYKSVTTSGSENNERTQPLETSGEFYGYIDKRPYSISRRNIQRTNAQTVLQKKYKWVKNYLGKYFPYAGGKENELFKYGTRIFTYAYNTLYGRDQYCNKVAQQNREKYLKIIEQKKTNKQIKEEFQKKITYMLNYINNHISYNEKLVQEIKQYYTKDKELFDNLIVLFGVYSKNINLTLKQIYDCQKQFIQLSNNVSSKYTSSYTLKSDKEQFNTYYNDIIIKFDELDATKNKIEEMLNNGLQ